MLYLFFDTETTGLIDRKLSLEHESQPRIIQLAAILKHEKKSICKINLNLKHDNLIIPEKITELTGITQKDHDNGVPAKEALHIFSAMRDISDARVGHNISFDKTMIAREELALGIERKKYHGQDFCTMQMSRPICKMPPTDKMTAAGIEGYKSPKLQEAYLHFFGKEFENAHNALADVEACANLFFHIKEQQKAA